MENNIIRVLIADDHSLFRTGLINLLKTNDELSIVGEASTGEELVQSYFSIFPAPDVLLVDISMPIKSGLDATKEILSRDRLAKILFLSMYEDEEYIYHCINAGGKGLVNKNISIEELTSTIKKINDGMKCFDNNINDEDLENLIKDKELLSQNETIYSKGNLSFREEQVLQLIGEGMTTKEIAEKLHVSKRTIDAHRVNIIQKFNLKSLPDLIKFAIFYSLKTRE